MYTAKQGLIGGETENHEVDNLDRDAIGVGNEGADADIEINHRPTISDKRVELEKKRRKIETQLYDDLRGLLPKLPPKAYKSTILDEAMNTIKELKQTLHNLKEQNPKRHHTTSAMAPFMPSESRVANNEASASMNLGSISVESSSIFKTWISSNVTLSVCGTEAIINICSMRNPALFTKVCSILEMHNLEIVSAQICSDHAKNMYMIRVQDPELANGVPSEEMFKRAVAQIVPLVICNF